MHLLPTYRYGDDCHFLVKNRRAGEGAMESTTQFMTKIMSGQPSPPQTYPTPEIQALVRPYFWRG